EWTGWYMDEWTGWRRISARWCCEHQVLRGSFGIAADFAMLRQEISHPRGLASIKYFRLVARVRPPFTVLSVIHGDRRERLPGRQRGARQTRRRAPREVYVSLPERAVGVGDHGRTTAVGLLADADVERQLGEQIHAVLLGHLTAAARTEDVLLMAATRAHVSAHVLDDPQHRHFHLLEHPKALTRVQQRDVLRRGDDHCTAHRHALRERELRVAGARRHVHDHIVQLPPTRRLEQLHERLR